MTRAERAGTPMRLFRLGLSIVMTLLLAVAFVGALGSMVGAVELALIACLVVGAIGWRIVAFLRGTS